MSADVIFPKATFIGIGLIGSSLAKAARKTGSIGEITVYDLNPNHREKALELGIADKIAESALDAVKEADLVMICTPPGACGIVAEKIGSGLKENCVVSDVGSVKQSIIDDVLPNLPAHVHYIPAHPIAGTEFSGPEAGLADLFEHRWLILTPLENTNGEAFNKVQSLWERVGSKIEIMDPKHHDKVLAITSHLPHLIAYSIVGTADDLGEHLKEEVIKFSASGFRDFTRIAASDPIMWRDIFLLNKDAILEILQRFSEDISYLQRAIRWEEGDKLEQLFHRTRQIRRDVLDANED